MALPALLPGASYTFAYERVAGAYGVTLSDRVVRFLAASAVLGSLAAGPAYLLYRHWISSGRLARGDVGAWLIELTALGYVAVPFVAGSLVGTGAKYGWKWLGFFIGGSHEPRAWDFVWRPGMRAVVRIKLKSESWLAGVFAANQGGRRSYAAGYPEPADLYLSTQLQVDAMTGEYVLDGDQPQPTEGNTGVLLRWDEIEYLEVQEF